MTKKYILKDDIEGNVSDDVIVVKKVKEVDVKGSTVVLYSPDCDKVKELDLLREDENYENSANNKG